MRKFILYAGMAFILSFYAAANIEAGSSGFNVSIDSADPCAGGAVDCTYVFTAKEGGGYQQIFMARRESKEYDDYSSADWYYYDLGIFTKSQAQAGYYIENDGDLVLVVAYSADQEDKSGAIVSRISKDYGETWSESKDVTNNQHKFGLSVAPKSFFVATNNNGTLTLHGFTWNNNSLGTWHNIGETNSNNKIASKGFAVLYNDNPRDIFGSPVLPYVSVSYITDSNTQQYRYYKVGTSTWTSFVMSQPEDGAQYVEDDVAYLYFANASGLTDYFEAYLFKDYNNVLKLETYKDPGTYASADVSNSGFNNISGVWKCPLTGKEYTLTIENLNIWGFGRDGAKTKLYTAHRGTSMQRRVSMFNVPAK